MPVALPQGRNVSAVYAANATTYLVTSTAQTPPLLKFLGALEVFACGGNEGLAAGLPVGIVTAATPNLVLNLSSAGSLRGFSTSFHHTLLQCVASTSPFHLTRQVSDLSLYGWGRKDLLGIDATSDPLPPQRIHADRYVTAFAASISNTILVTCTQ